MTNGTVWNYFNPVKIEYRPLENLSTYKFARNILIVTTDGFMRRGTVGLIKSMLKSSNIFVCTDFCPNPNVKDVADCVDHFKSKSIGHVIGLGGGSALDVSKVVAIMLKNSDYQLDDLVNPNNNHLLKNMTRLPLIAVPTTAGTGSEVTPFATLWDHNNHKKISISSNYMFPDTALLDPDLTRTLNYDQTLYPALDTMSHALESLWNKNRTPVTISLALRSLLLINKTLPDLLVNLDDLNLRKNIQIASLLSGLAISQTKTAIAHSISYPLTAHFGIPHGLASSFTLATILRLNVKWERTPKEFISLMRDAREILVNLSLRDKIFEYTTREQILIKQEEMWTVGRADNYIGAPIVSLHELLSEALD